MSRCEGVFGNWELDIDPFPHFGGCLRLPALWRCVAGSGLSSGHMISHPLTDVPERVAGQGAETGQGAGPCPGQARRTDAAKKPDHQGGRNRWRHPLHQRSGQEVEIKPQISGIIDKIYFEEGAIVKKGDLIATVRVVPNEQNLTSARGNVSNLKLSVDTLSLSLALRKTESLKITLIKK